MRGDGEESRASFGDKELALNVHWLWTGPLEAGCRRTTAQARAPPQGPLVLLGTLGTDLHSGSLQRQFPCSLTETLPSLGPAQLT